MRHTNLSIGQRGLFWTRTSYGYYISFGVLVFRPCFKPPSLWKMLYSREPVYAPLDGTVNISETIEFNWKHNADYPAFVYNEDGTNHITEISNLEFGRACHRAAHALRPEYNTTIRPTVAFIALTDVLLYQAIVIGMMRANIVVRTFIFFNLCLTEG